MFSALFQRSFAVSLAFVATIAHSTVMPFSAPVFAGQGIAPGVTMADAQISALRAERDELKWIAASGGWPQISAQEKLEFAQVSQAVATLRARLVIGGDLTEDHAHASNPLAAQTFDLDLLQAVLRFQTRHGIETDGVVGPATIRALNVPVETRLAQVDANLARWQELAPKVADNMALVNIPEYKLRLYSHGQQHLDMRVVVGSQRHPTPELTEELEYLVVNPYWYVPKRISAQELLPKVQEDPAYFAKARYEVWADGNRVAAEQVAWNEVSADDFNYSLRQKPGANNSLGQMKFALPNTRNIYLHDTPAKQHFELNRRAYSHGCIRLEEPQRFAEEILAMQNGWDPASIGASLGVDYTKRVNLDAHLPVHITYLTNWAHGGVVHYYEDVYGRDRQYRKPAQPAPTPRTYTASASVDSPESQNAPDVVWSATPADSR